MKNVELSVGTPSRKVILWWFIVWVAGMIFFGICLPPEDTSLVGLKLVPFTPFSFKHPEKHVVTRSEVWEYLMSNKSIKYPHIVYNQILLETGCKGKWVDQNNNLTCMRLPKKRKTLAIGEKNGYAVYRSWKECIDDYALFQQMFTGHSESDYYQFLRMGRYSSDSSYVDTLIKRNVSIPITHNLKNR